MFHDLPLTPRSLRPKRLSILAKSNAEGRSCLLARTRTGTCLLDDLGLVLEEVVVVDLQMLSNSSLASSRLSSLEESTTKMMPSVQRVYDLQRGLNLS